MELTMRILTLCLSVAVALFGGSATAVAQNVENGLRLSERWCTECHAIGTAPGKPNRAQSFAAIAAKETVTSEMIASFLLLPHATMPNPPLRRKDAQDIAAFIMGMKK
jgi:mono/diheme cytochrome c family protein